MPQLVCFGWRAYRRGEGGNTSNVALPGRPRLRLVRCFAYSDGGDLQPAPSRQIASKRMEECRGDDTRGDPQTAAFRRGQARQAARRGRDRRARRHVQAQRAVSARRLPLLLLRQHGCHRRQPVPADPGVPQGQARRGRLRRLRHGELREGARQVLAGRPRLGDHGQPGGEQQARGAHQEARRRAPGRHRNRVSPRRRRGHAAPRVVRTSILSTRWCRWSGCAHCKTPARARLSARGVGTRHRIHAGDLQAVQARRRPRTRSPKPCGARRSTAAWCSTIAC